MGDGANMGISAERALATVLGGEGQPTEEEKATTEQVRERVMQAPDPCTGEPIYERGEDVSYSLATDAIAKAFLLAEEEEPGILERREHYPDPYLAAPSLAGKEKGAETVVWDYVMKKHPGFDEWIGGATGFMVGFAYNAARYVLSKPPMPNPAIIEIN